MSRHGTDERHHVAKRLAIAAGAAVLMAIAVVALAIANLNTIIARNRGRFIALVSYRLGRPVAVEGVKVHLGWGIAVELDGLRVADDPAFSTAPFITARGAYLNLALMPLLRSQAIIRELTFLKPVIRVVRNNRGAFNLSSLGGIAGRAGAKPSAPETGYEHTVERALLVDSLSIEDGTVYFIHSQAGAVPAAIEHLDLDVTDFSLRAPFNLAIKLALLTGEDNFTLDGTVGPLLERGLAWSRLPLDLRLTAGPLAMDQLAQLLERAGGGMPLPPGIGLPDPVAVQGSLTGPALNPAFRLAFDLNHYRVITGASPAGTQTGASSPSDVVTVSGAAAIQGRMNFASGRPQGVTVVLRQVAFQAGANAPPISKLDATVALTPGGGMRLSKSTFAIGRTQLSAQGGADSLRPLKAQFMLNADNLNLADLGPGVPAGNVSRLAIGGIAAGQLSAPQITALIRSGGGIVAGLAYSNLNWNAGWDGHRLTAQPLTLNAFGGSINVTGGVSTDTRHGFEGSFALTQVDLKPMLRWAGVKSSALQGLLSGQVRIAGHGQTWGRIRPGLSGSGRLQLVRGKLRGTNIVAAAVNKIAAAPGVNILVDATFQRTHQGLLADPDTELDSAGLSFTLAAQRVSTSDLVINSSDYGITGAGWFDFDDNVSMRSDIRLTLGLSVAIPVLVMGRYPVLIVLPDLTRLAERIAVGTLNAPGNIIRGGINGIGGVLNGFKGLVP